MTEDPTRLAALPSSPELTSMIQTARARVPDAMALARLKSGLQASLSVPLSVPPPELPAPAPTPNANPASLARLVPLSVALPVLLVAVGGALLGLHFSSSRPRASGSTAAEIAAPRSTPRAALSETRLAPTATPEATNNAAPAPVALRSTSAPRAQASALAPRPSAELPRPSEVELVGQAGRILKADPTRALALTNQHRQLYPVGALSEEREVIAIEALARLGALEAARTRAEQFISSFPRSAHFPRVVAAAQLQTIDAGTQEKPNQRAPRE